jgi:hypothetical protein
MSDNEPMECLDLDLDEDDENEHVGSSSTSVTLPHPQPNPNRPAAKSRCTVERCRGVAVYGEVDDERPTLCKRHARTRSNFVRILPVLGVCIYRHCLAQAAYGSPTKQIKEYCSKHGRLFPDVVNLRRKQCEVDGCERYATYGHEYKKFLLCKQHGEVVGMHSVVNRSCMHRDCFRTASYGFRPGERRCCAGHGKPRGMLLYTSPSKAFEDAMVSSSEDSDSDIDTDNKNNE